MLRIRWFQHLINYYFDGHCGRTIAYTSFLNGRHTWSLYEAVQGFRPLSFSLRPKQEIYGLSTDNPYGGSHYIGKPEICSMFREHRRKRMDNNFCIECLCELSEELKDEPHAVSQS